MKLSLFAISALFMLLAFAGAGCRNKDKYKTELAALDSADSSLGALLQSSRQIDTTGLRTKADAITSNLRCLDTLLPDTISDRELAVLLMDYRALLNPLEQCPYKLKEWKNLVQETRQRINNLRSDLTKDITDEKQVKNYVEAEKQNTTQLTASFSVMNSLLEEARKKSDSLDLLVKGRITELQILKKEKKK